ncbi:MULTISPECIES: lantibiotic dehydratase [Micromonospora]|uniref:lantibiotic dehydratase n=1 Tax=Micromonospora TaxID=1873 RepID=UPI0001BF2EB3|nr:MULTISPECIES: lantibiotic dehydratase [Micromonospora]ADL49624.1 Lantibiotic dehydratase domain protein [Micromonospora aurantiaca ATCC 27029]
MLPQRTFEPVGPALVRASTDPGNLGPEPGPDLIGPAASTEAGLAWLAGQWSRPDVRDAISIASPHLARRVDQLLAADASGTTAAAVRRAVLATCGYLLRWQRRTTPFGLFAAVTTATVGPASATFGDKHRAVARVDGEWLTCVVDRLEAHHALRRRLFVVADSAAVVRDGRVIVAAWPPVGQRTPGMLRETSTRNTAAVRLALQVAAWPIRFDRLLAQIMHEVPHVAVATVEAMLHGLIDGGFLITNLRPPMTAVDGLTHVIDALHSAEAAELPQVTASLDQLCAIRQELARHDAQVDGSEAMLIRAAVTEPMTVLAPNAEHQLAIDVRLDAQISLPPPVLAEAALAVDLLLRLSTQPFGSVAWLDYHARFRDRYGPGALVPVRDLLADSGLGYPTGYLGAPRARPAWRVITERDTHLQALIQQAILDNTGEIHLTDADIEALTVGDHHTAVRPPRVELAFAVHATAADAIDRGEFTVQVTGAPRTPSSMAGRFSYLLEPTEQEQVTASFSTRGRDADEELAVQVSFPPRLPRNQNVTRVGRILPFVLPLSEQPDWPDISLDDVAVTADSEQMYLVHQPTGRRIVPHIPHALDTIVQTPPLARFLAEVADARSIAFGPLDHGAAARNLPYIPRIRYRRVILAPARWLLNAADIPPHTPPGAGDTEGRWDAALTEWRRRWRVPARVVACQNELQLPLDLDSPLDRALLRARLGGAERLELREDAPADGYGWTGGHPAEFLSAMTPTAPPARRLPVTAPPGDTLRPGTSTFIHTQIAGNPARFDELLTTHLPRLADRLAGLGLQRWWIRRDRDTIRVEADQRLSLFLRLNEPAAHAAACAILAEFAADLARRALPAQLIFAPYHQHPARYGHGPAQHAAEEVFAADTTAAIAQLRTAEQTDIPAQALAAASMARLAAAFAPDPDTGYGALLACLQQAAAPAERTITDLARRLADPTTDYRSVRALPGGDAIADAWRARDHALSAYYERLLPQRDPTTVLRTLLHEHHVRAVGVDPDFERATNHAARAAAMRCLAAADTR